MAIDVFFSIMLVFFVVMAGAGATLAVIIVLDEIRAWRRGGGAAMIVQTLLWAIWGSAVVLYLFLSVRDHR